MFIWRYDCSYYLIEITPDLTLKQQLKRDVSTITLKELLLDKKNTNYQSDDTRRLCITGFHRVELGVGDMTKILYHDMTNFISRYSDFFKGFYYIKCQYQTNTTLKRERKKLNLTEDK